MNESTETEQQRMDVPDSGAHGGDGRSVALALGLDPTAVLDLSASLNPFAPDPAPLVTRAIERGALDHYPSPEDEDCATRAMAASLGVDPSRVLLTNGGAEAIALVAAELGSGWVDEPEFSLYRRHLPSLDRRAPRFRSDPHNPLGHLATTEEIADVWDEAFYPLATGAWSRTALARSGVLESLARDRPAIALGSITKVFRCPGLRVGFIVVPDDDGAGIDRPDLRARLFARRPCWAVSTPAIWALPGLLETADITKWARDIVDARHELCNVLVAHGLLPRPSSAPWVLVDHVPGIRDPLARAGVVVRDCAGFGLAETIRIAVPDGDGLARLDGALTAVFDRLVR